MTERVKEGQREGEKAKRIQGDGERENTPFSATKGLRNYHTVGIKKEILKEFEMILPESQGQNLALTVLCAIFARKRLSRVASRVGGGRRQRPRSLKNTPP